MKEMILRDYQIDMVSKILQSFENFDSIMCQMPTGTGKTEVFCKIIQLVLESHHFPKVLVIVHRKELLQQIKSRLISKAGIYPETIEAENRYIQYDRTVYVGMIQTVLNRNVEVTPSLIVIDEAHHSMASNYRKLINLCISRNSNVKLLGVTATPSRLDGKRLSDIFQHLILSPGIVWFIKNQYLSKIKYLGIKDIQLNRLTVSELTGDFEINSMSSLMRQERVLKETISSYMDFAYNKKTLIFCVDQQHSFDVQLKFREIRIHADIIDSNTNPDERTIRINRFKRMPNGVLINVNIFTEGFDCPDIDVVILARPTQSLTLYLQMIGRVTRTYPGKQHGIILDNAGNYKIHGLPIVNYDWLELFRNPDNLDNRTIAEKSRENAKVKIRELPLESKNIDLCELIDESLYEGFDVYDDDLQQFTSIDLSNPFEKILNGSRNHPSNYLAYYFHNHVCENCNEKIFRFVNIYNEHEDFDEIIPNWKLHVCYNSDDHYNGVINRIYLPAVIENIITRTPYEYQLTVLGINSVQRPKFYYYQEFPSNILDGKSPVLITRINDREIKIKSYDLLTKDKIEINVYIENIVFFNNHMPFCESSFVRELNVKTASLFIKGERHVLLSKYELISDDAAKVLASGNKSLFLDSLQELSSVGANYLGSSNLILSLNGLKSISNDVAIALSQNSNYVSLSGLTKITPGVATALGNQNGRLVLDGLDFLPSSIAEKLSNHTGPLFLNGLTSISIDAAQKLSSHNGQLSLNGLTTISSQIAGKFQNHKGGISLNGITFLDIKTAKKFINYTDFILLAGLSDIQENILACFSQNVSHLDFSGLHSIEGGLAKTMSKFKADLVIDGISHLSKNSIENISLKQGFISLNGLKAIPEYFNIFIDDHSGGLSLNGLSRLSDDDAEKLSNYNGPLNLDGLTELSFNACKFLSKHKFDLTLNGIKEISITELQILKRHKGKVSLIGLNEIDNEQVEFFSKNEKKFVLL
jgi:superfamily II DNA or RNA helicase